MGRRKRCGRCSSQLLLSEGCHRTLVKQHVHATILGVRGWSPSREGMLMDRLTVAGLDLSNGGHAADDMWGELHRCMASEVAGACI